MTAISALGFMLVGLIFGAIGGALVLARWWVSTLHKPEVMAKMLASMGESFRKRDIKACPDHGCPICTGRESCPACDRAFVVTVDATGDQTPSVQEG